MAEIIKMDENTWRFEDVFVRYFLLTGEKQAVMIDSGCNSPDALMLARTLTELPILLLNTHGDGDHVAGTGAFPEIYMGEEDFVNCKVKDRFPDTKLIPVNDGQRIDLGGRTLEIITIPGHTYGSIAVLDVEKKVLYAGDSVQDGQIFMFGPHRSKESFAMSMQKLIDMEDRFDTVVGSHATPVLPKSQVRVVLANWEQVLANKVEGTKMDMHGNEVLSYTLEGCGFYC